ncbi:hypothetical protein JAAARDRAFT_39236 [Jaapia argillacea MUCL 33604]|uniref:Cation efflux protein transmembrane domain-containing protein n=1 Tax=Jaapia argillacea MUCL 33604 TaxID=933084 RepID=A0A067PF67_9AGAM|nr:hypothetical protein JAAARDRAFT_39236 [Jaapia argillacea MUCL 33604]
MFGHRPNCLSGWTHITVGTTSTSSLPIRFAGRCNTPLVPRFSTRSSAATIPCPIRGFTCATTVSNNFSSNCRRRTVILATAIAPNTSPSSSSNSLCMNSRRPYSSTEVKGKETVRVNGNANGSTGLPQNRHEHKHEDGDAHHEEHHAHEAVNGSANGTHSHTHSHSIFSAHTHSVEERDFGAERVMQALKGGGDRGSQITLVGLFANVGLTASKGAAGWFMNSASLLADAGHSLSDLLGDFVTLFCWKLSRKPPSERYPFGFSKFETLGTTTVSLLLIGGALGIGFHSYHLLAEALSQTAASLPPGPVAHVVTGVAQHLPSAPPIAAHAHVHALDPNAAWFAAVSIVTKEWLYRATKRVADDEKSPVLLANAVHHRSDAYSSMVALVAILGSWWFPALPLDPLGGLLVSVVILQQGLSILGGAFGELTDASVSSKSRASLTRALAPLVSPSTHSSSHPPSPSHLLAPSDRVERSILAIRNIRARRAGALVFVDLTADVPRTLSVEETSSLEGSISRTLKEAGKEVAEVRVKFNPVDVRNGKMD